MKKEARKSAIFKGQVATIGKLLVERLWLTLGEDRQEDVVKNDASCADAIHALFIGVPELV